jgi:NAD(P)-dependent dehydrogenase (short-subunit alcohol dehydrogenase family)
MNLKLRGKRALVTGSTQGIGYAIAQGLAREGAEVVVNGRGEAKVRETVKRIAAETEGSVTGLAGDVGSATEVDRLVEKLGPVDILINNAGIFEPKPFLEIPDSDWIRFFEVNVMSGVRLSRALLPHMLKQNWGRIIFISSESGLNIPAEMVHYGMTKTAQLALSRGIAESIAGTGVTVNAVLPGPTLTEGVPRSSSKWRTPWSIFAARRHRRPPVRRFVWTAASSAVSPRPVMLASKKLWPRTPPDRGGVCSWKDLVATFNALGHPRARSSGCRYRC